jgi:hypothetical protein
MIDRHRRAEVALLLRRLGSGRLPAPEYEDRYYDHDIINAPDRGVPEVAYFGWTLFGDLDDRLIGHRAVRSTDRKVIARAVLFLRSDEEYGWPPHPAVMTWTDVGIGLIRLITFGLVRIERREWKKWRTQIDLDTWPFKSPRALKAARRRWPFSSNESAV